MVSKINLIKRIAVFVVLAGLCACDSSTDKSKVSRPNIIFIMSDDHARRTVSSYEGAINQTPNIDRISDEGVLFLNSFVANSICGPSRASILTGKMSHKNGVVGNASPWNNQQTLFPRLLQQNGYTTALIGKWHLNSPPGDEFSYADRLTGAGKQGFYYNPEFVNSNGSTETIQGYSTDLVTDKSLDWLSENTGKEKNPFMLFVQYKAPHVPRMPEFRFLGKYANDSISEPETLFDDYTIRTPNAEAANMGIHFRSLPPMNQHNWEDDIYFTRMTKEQRITWHRYQDPDTKAYMNMQQNGVNEQAIQKFAYQKFIKDYMRIIDGVDENVGRLLDWLDDHPAVNKNTFVVYTSDQGYFTGQHGWAEKRFMYEESITMPLMIRWPGQVEEGTKIEAPVQNIDFAPTFLEAAGVKVPPEMQGQSLVSLMKSDESETWRNSVYYHYYDHGIHGVARHDGVRTDRHKLINFYTNDEWELYDLDNDPHEVNNIYENPRNEEIIAKLKDELNQLRNQYEVPTNHFQAPFVKAGKDQKL